MKGVTTTTKGLAYFYSTAGILLMINNPALTIILDRFFSNAFYQRFLAGERLFYPDMILYNLADIEILPIDISEFLEEWMGRLLKV